MNFVYINIPFHQLYLTHAIAVKFFPYKVWENCVRRVVFKF